MKAILYITKSKVWVGEHEFEWNGVSFDSVMGKVKKALKGAELRIVLGNDISFVTAVKAKESFLSRENVLKMVKPWMPFEIDDECFDWKEIILARDEIWLQVIAVEKELLNSLSASISKYGLKVDLVTTIGVLLGEKTLGREAPVVIKWKDKEKLLVLAINGLVDLVVSDVNEEDLMVYALQKWNLAVNPEVIPLNIDEFNLPGIVLSKKTKGEDRFVLNLPLLKGVLTENEVRSKSIWGDEFLQKEEAKNPKTMLWVLIIVLLIIMGVGAFFLVSKLKNPASTVTPSPNPTLEITPEPTKVDLRKFQVQVLNGSGVKGEAAKIKTNLLSSGFENVEIGNTTATSEGKILSKDTVPEIVVNTVWEQLSIDYEMRENGMLEQDDKYDLIVIIGSVKEL